MKYTCYAIYLRLFDKIINRELSLEHQANIFLSPRNLSQTDRHNSVSHFKAHGL